MQANTPMPAPIAAPATWPLPLPNIDPASAPIAPPTTGLHSGDAGSAAFVRPASAAGMPSSGICAQPLTRASMQAAPIRLIPRIPLCMASPSSVDRDAAHGLLLCLLGAAQETSGGRVAGVDLQRGLGVGDGGRVVLLGEVPLALAQQPGGDFLHA